MQPWELAKLFKNLQHLELRQHPEVAYKDNMSSFEQLTALRKLKSLKVHWHHSQCSVLLVITDVLYGIQVCIKICAQIHPTQCSDLNAAYAHTLHEIVCPIVPGRAILLEFCAQFL